MSAPAPRIVVTINADGSVEAVTEGVHGEDCVDRIATLESLLDATTIESRFTADYHSQGVSTADSSQAVEFNDETLRNDI